MHSLIELGVSVAPHERASPLLLSEGLLLAQQGHTTQSQAPDHSFEGPFTAVCGRGEQSEGVPAPLPPALSQLRVPTNPTTALLCSAPVAGLKEVRGLSCGVTAGDGSPWSELVAWAGLGCGQGGRRGGLSV